MEQNAPKLNSVEKALRILMSFDEERPVWGVRRLSDHLGFSPATVQRLLQTLKNHGFVAQIAETRQYLLGNVYYRFLHTLQSAMPITQAALPSMKLLLAETQETVHLNVIDGHERLCIDTLESPQSLKASMPIGSRSPLYAGASSKCLLTYTAEEFRDAYLQNVQLEPITPATITDKNRLLRDLQKTREKAYAESLGERNIGLGSFSVPILNHRGTLLAALSLAIPEIRFKKKEHRRFCLNSLQSIGRELSRRMGYNA